jgi:cytochrome P450
MIGQILHLWTYIDLTTMLMIGIPAVLLWLIFLIVIKPYLLCQYYAKQGAVVMYKPGLGMYAFHKANVFKHGDFFHWHKQTIKKDPNIKIVTANIFDKCSITLWDPALIKDFNTKHEKYYEKSPLMRAVPSMLFGKGLVFSEGASWRRHRRIISQAFHYEFYQEMIPVIKRIAQTHFTKLAQRENLKAVELRHEFENITGQVMSQIFFGDSLSEAGLINGKDPTNELSEISSEVFAESIGVSSIVLGAWFIKMGVLPKHKLLMTRMQNYLKFTQEIVHKRRQEAMQGTKKSGRTDLLHKFLEVQDVNSEEYLSDEEIVHEYITFVTAGMDTASLLLTMTICHLLYNPDYIPEVKKEAKDLLSTDANLTTSVLSQTTLISACLKETLRITPPGSSTFQRIALDDHKIGNFNVKKGTLLNIGLLVVGNNPKYYENPEKYQPERWLEKTNDERSDPFTYIPFSFGSRNCIGQQLAMIESKLTLSIFLNTFDFKIPEHYVHRMTMRLMHEPQDPFIADLTPVKN